MNPCPLGRAVVNRIASASTTPVTGFCVAAVLLFATPACSQNVAGNSNSNRDSTPADRLTAQGSNSQLQNNQSAGGPVAAPTPEEVEQINTDPAKLAVAFYEYYVDGFPRINEERVIFSRYLTPRFFDQALKAEDYDVFLNAQDFDTTWKNNISASDKVITGNKATVNVHLRGETFKWVLKVSLLKRNGTWKIDGVKGRN